MVLHIVDATTVNPLWVSQILISADGGATWHTTIKKENVKSINQVRIANAKNVSNSSQHQHSEKIHIEMNDGVRIKFDVKDVVNQAGWVVGGVAGLAAAHADVTTFLS